jgi:endonuclease YncB( thermonuclease family)
MKHIYTFLCLFLLSGAAFSDVIGKAYVTDGDTVKVGDVRVRLHGIDAPEQKQKCWKGGQAWLCGQESTKTLNTLINNQIITCKGDTTDQYGRLIAVCYLKTTDLNAAIVEAGMAVASRKYSIQYVLNEQNARQKHKGMWTSDFVYPWDWRQGKRFADGHAYVISIEYRDGAYTGEIFRGVPHGRGDWTFTDGRRFIGGFKRGYFHGYVDATFSDGSTYVGNYHRNLRHGYGTVTKIDGSTYVGNFSSDKRHGQGTRTYADGSRFIGKYKTGARWTGTEYDKDGNITATFLDRIRTE